VLTVSADVYRPAAIEQLKTVTGQAGDFFPSQPDQKPVDIALAALDYAKKHYDVLLVDTAGRLAIDEAMMAEIRRHAAIKPIETLFVVDAMQGQDAINTAKAFNEALPLTGVVLTKLDGDSRGGAALSVRQITGKPIKFAGVSENSTAWSLRPAHGQPRAGHGRHRGAGGRRSRKGVDMEAARSWPKVKSGDKFDLNDKAAAADEEDGRPVQPDGQAAGPAAGRRQRQHGPGREAGAPHGRHHRLHDRAGTRQAGADQGHRKRRIAGAACRCRKSTACSTSSSRCRP
jgi:hypothetical protein